MSEQILDGTGTGKKLKINAKNQAAVAAVSVEEITHISSVDAQTYQFHTERVLVAAATLENIAHIEYTGDFQLQIDSIILSREDVALDSSGQALVEIRSNVVYTSGGDAIIPVNMNLGSSNVSEVTLFSGTTTIVLDTTLEKEILDVTFNTVYNHVFKGGLILKKGDTIALIGKSLNIGDTIHAAIYGYVVKGVI